MKRSEVMRRSHRTAMLAVAAVFALGGSGYAAAGVHGHSPGRPSTVPPPQGHGNGVACQGVSKSHVPGEQGTPFSNCVTARAHSR